MAIHGDNVLNVRLKKCEVLDLTGAGDLFAAGYIHGVVNNMNNRKS